MRSQHSAASRARCQIARRFKNMGVPCLFLLSTAVVLAQSQAIPFLDDSQVQSINFTMAPADWAALQQNYELDTYYHATFVWNGISEDVGIRSHGGGSRSPIKPNLDVNFAKYTKAQTLLGLPFIILKANNEDASNLNEWISMKLYRKMGIPAPREAPAQVFVNGQLLGFYYIVEHEDETFLQRNFGESGGYLYSWQAGGNYDFGNLGADPSLYANFLDLKTNQTAPDLQTFDNLVQAINQPGTTDDAFVAAVSQYVDPKQFLAYGATEQVLAGADGLLGGLEGMNNFYLYQFQGTTQYYFIPWDKDMTFADSSRNLMFGIAGGPNINLLAQRLAAIPQYQQAYLGFAAKAAELLGGTGGWADQEITREYAVIHAAATNDPNKQCMYAGTLSPCGNADFEAGVQWIHSFLASRSDFVESELAVEGYQPPTDGPQVAPGAVTSWGGMQAVSPGGVATINGSALAAKGTAPSAPLPRVLGGAYVSVEGVRAPLFTTDSGTIEFQVPEDIPVGAASIVACNSGAMSATVDVNVEGSTPYVLAVEHQDGSPVSAADPPTAYETLTIYATGLGAVSGNFPSGAAGTSSPLATAGSTPQVNIAGVPLTVTFAGLAPGFVGLYQINVAMASAPLPGIGSVNVTLADNGQTATWASQ